MTAEDPWQQAHRILCVRLDNMGDVLMTTPALRALKHAVAGRSLDLLTSPAAGALAAFLPYVDRVITYAAPWVKNPEQGVTPDLEMITTLRSMRYDAAVIFTVYSQSPLPAAFLCRLAGIPRVLAHCRENPYDLISDWCRETEPQQQIRHEVQRQLDLVATVGACCADTRLTFTTRSQDAESLKNKLASTTLATAGKWMVAHCGASAASRRYPADQFAQALTLIGDRAGPIVMTGDASERSLIQSIVQACNGRVPLIDMAGMLSLGEFACLLEQASVLLSNNTGPVHIAAALGTPVVDLYALTNPQHTPWQVPQRVLYNDVPCKYCYRSVCPEHHHACLRGVRPEEVCSAVIELLAVTDTTSRQRLAGVA